MGKLIDFPPRSEPLVVASVDGDGGGPHDGDMEARVRELEKSFGDVRERLARIETKLESVATKMDIADLKNSFPQLEARLIRWFVATAVTIGGLVAALSFGLTRLFGSLPPPG